MSDIWSNIQDVSFYFKDINHLHSLMLQPNSIQTIQNVGMLTLIHVEWIILRKCYNHQNVNFIWTLDCILLTIIAEILYTRL
jgi:hypothetical protein